MDRRRFLSLGAAVSLSVATPAVWAWPDSSVEPEALARPVLPPGLGGPARIRDLGRRYRAARPDENGRNALKEALRRDLNSEPPGAAPDRLEAQVQADFADGRTVQLDGWILSVTEARQCALFSLLHEQPSRGPNS